MKRTIFTGFLLAFFQLSVSSQNISMAHSAFEANQVAVSNERLKGVTTLRVIKDSSVTEVDEPTFARIKDFTLRDGTIEVKVLSRLLPSAPSYARGFIGLAFRIDSSNKKFESIYIRPTNGRSDDQVRRNHSVQYFSYPDYKFDRLRKESPEKYETYADMTLNEWIDLKIVVNGSTALLFLNNSKLPVFVVNDLKLGSGEEGGIGLWVEVGTEGFFKDLKVSK